MKDKLIYGFMMSALIIVLTACGESQAESDTRQKLSFPVETQMVDWHTEGIGAEYSASVTAARSARLSTRVMGLVQSIEAKEGEAVSQGQVLLRLRSQDIAAKKSQAAAMLRAAENAHLNAKTQLDRIEALFAKSAATRKELDDTRLAFQTAESQLEVARQAVKEANEALRYSQITAPFPGVVSRKMVKTGDFVNPGQPLLEVSNLSEMEVLAKISASEIAQLKVGQESQILVPDAGENFRVSATVARIAPAADPLSRQFDVIFRVENREGLLKPGMFARVSVNSAGTQRLLIPQKAVFNRGQLQGVYVLDGQQVLRLRWIRTGSEFGEKVEVLAGLNQGDLVVVNRINDLVDGSQAEVK